MNGQYGPYIMYAISRLLQKRQESPGGSPGIPENLNREDGTHEVNVSDAVFGADETGAVWHREEDLMLLEKFCREGYAQALKHGHYLIGSSSGTGFIGIPGRFLLEDQPAGGKTGFTLWQALRGGEELYGELEEMDRKTAEEIYGYWIAALDINTLRISEV